MAEAEGEMPRPTRAPELVTPTELTEPSPAVSPVRAKASEPSLTTPYGPPAVLQPPHGVPKPPPAVHPFPPEPPVVFAKATVFQGMINRPPSPRRPLTPWGLTLYCKVC